MRVNVREALPIVYLERTNDQRFYKAENNWDNVNAMFPSSIQTALLLYKADTFPRLPANTKTMVLRVNKNKFQHLACSLHVKLDVPLPHIHISSFKYHLYTSPQHWVVFVKFLFVSIDFDSNSCIMFRVDHMSSMVLQVSRGLC